MIIVDFLAGFIACVIALPLWIVSVECWIALLAEKIRDDDHKRTGMRVLKSIFYTPHPNPLPEGEGIFNGSDKLIETDLSKVVILIPAHNESAVIDKTLSGLFAQFPSASNNSQNGSLASFSHREKVGMRELKYDNHSFQILGETVVGSIGVESDDLPKASRFPGQAGNFKGFPKIVVVADNCTDNTADIARQFNVTVLERTDSELRGKGYALDYGIQFLKGRSDIDVLIVLDADCELKPLALEKLVQQCLVLRLPVQALYMMHLPENASIKQRIAGFAWLVKNKIRPLAVSQLNLPVTLTGTGMAFPWHLMDRINLAHGHIAEDMQLGIELALKGYPPQLCPDAEVYSYFPEQQSAQKTQRTRWEHGHLMTIIEQVPRLVNQAMIKSDVKLLALALDTAVPPLTLLVLLALGTIGVLSVFYALTDRLVPVGLLLASFAFFACTILVVWWREGRSLLSFADLCSVPVYIFSKLSVYFSFIVRRQKDWVRTERGGGEN